MVNLDWLIENRLQEKHMKIVDDIGKENIEILLEDDIDDPHVYKCSICIFRKTCEYTDVENFKSVCNEGSGEIYYSEIKGDEDGKASS